jgi:hypothetical protein
VIRVRTYWNEPVSSSRMILNSSPSDISVSDETCMNRRALRDHLRGSILGWLRVYVKSSAFHHSPSSSHASLVDPPHARTAAAGSETSRLASFKVPERWRCGIRMV